MLKTLATRRGHSDVLYSADVVNHGQEYSESAAAVTINIEGVSLNQILQEILYFEGRMKLASPGG